MRQEINSYVRFGVENISVFVFFLIHRIWEQSFSKILGGRSEAVRGEVKTVSGQIECEVKTGGGDSNISPSPPIFLRCPFLSSLRSRSISTALE